MKPKIIGEYAFMKFHWLRIDFRIIYKLNLIVHNCIKRKAPNEIINLIEYGESSRTMKLVEPRTRTKYGDKSFTRVGPKLWNLLPITIRQEPVTPKFKKKLKTFLMLKGDEYCSWIERR